MQVVRMKAERRSALGRNRVAVLRKEGWLPAVVYGEGQEPISISISEWELEQHVKAHHRVFQLEIGGVSQAAFLQAVSWENTTDHPVHVDFKRIDLTKPIEADIEVVLAGHAIGLTKGGTMVKDHIVIKVRCLPTEIPDSIEHDVAKLEIDDIVLASQLVLPTGVSLVTPGTTAVCHVAKLAAQEVPAAPVAVPVAEAAAGEKAGDKPADKGADKPAGKGDKK